MPKKLDTGKLTGDAFVAEASKFIGDPYVLGAAGPTHFDCSGLVQYALEQLGMKNVPRTSELQYGWSDPIKEKDLRPGDLVFSQWPGDGLSPGHVAIYAGGGQLVEAPKPGESVHKIPLNSFYKKYVTAYGRIPGASVAATDTTSSSSSGGGGQSLSSEIGEGAIKALEAIPGIGDLFKAGQEVSDVAKSILGVFGPIAMVFEDMGQSLEAAMTAVVWLVNPMNWLRMVAGAVGFVSFIAGAVLVATSA